MRQPIVYSCAYGEYYYAKTVLSGFDLDSPARS